MPLTAKDLEALKGAGIIDSETADRIEDFFAATAAPPFKLDLLNVAQEISSLALKF